MFEQNGSIETASLQSALQVHVVASSFASAQSPDEDASRAKTASPLADGATATTTGLHGGSGNVVRCLEKLSLAAWKSCRLSSCSSASVAKSTDTPVFNVALRQPPGLKSQSSDDQVCERRSKRKQRQAASLDSCSGWNTEGSVGNGRALYGQYGGEVARHAGEGQ
jgi:hypothetical protein